jgi:predicted nicotinamide N-methyase
VLRPADLRAYVSRTLQVEVEPGVIFAVLEVLGQPRPNHWARVWPTSLAMSRWLLDQPPGSLAGAAIELGCGMALVSLTLAHLGVEIESTDRQPLAVAFAVRNGQVNGVAGFTGSVLEWGSPVTASTKLVVAADVVYEAGAGELLFALVHTAGLLAPGGRLLLGVPQARREPGDELVARFSDQGYGHRHEARAVSWEGRAELIDLHLLTRRLVAGATTRAAFWSSPILAGA